MLIEGANDIKIIWSDKRIKILTDLFQNFYNHKKIWRIYISGFYIARTNI